MVFDAHAHVGSRPGRVGCRGRLHISLSDDVNLPATWHRISCVHDEIKYCTVEKCGIDQAVWNTGTKLQLDPHIRSRAISQERLERPEEIIQIASMGIEFLMLCEGE